MEIPRDIMTDTKSRFTEQDNIDIGKLPQSELNLFGNRLAQITIRVQIVEDNYSADMDEIREDGDILFEEIKIRLEIFRETGC